MKNKLFPWICLSILFPFFLNAQCGTDPVSGLTTISGASQIANTYYPGTGNPIFSANSLTVGTLDARGNATPIAANDLVLIIQMQGADINSANSDSYGNGVSGGAASGYLTAGLYAGNYEYNTVASVAGSVITFSNTLAHNYYTRAFASGPIRSYQVIRVPRNYDLTISGSVTCPFWNGSTGGVVVMDAANVLTISGSINVTGLGFRGGGGINFGGASGSITNTDYRWDSPVTNSANGMGGAKGEGIAGTPIYVLNPGSTTITVNGTEGYTNGTMGRGAPGNAGGGSTDGTLANAFNSGGGGGGNAGAGGRGGSGWHNNAGNVNTYPTGGYGGLDFAQRSIQRLIMGGGGGAGSANNSTAANQYMSSGGTGGGIILLRAKSYAGTGTLNADGGDAIGVTGGGGNTDAAGGGGGGGTIIAVTRQNVTVGLTGVTANARGGKGGNMETYFDHGPGGGGGGGMIITNGTFSAANITAGTNGLTRTGTTGGPINNAYGATPGTNGQLATLASAPPFDNSFNPGSPCGVLPVTLISFTAVASGSAVILNWEIGDALNFARFEVEYSTNGYSFSGVGQVSFDPQRLAYQYLHSPVTAPVNYYRLKMIDIDGSSRYSSVLVVRMGLLSKDLLIYPKPARDHVTVSIKADRQQSAVFGLFNSAGNKMREVKIKLNNGSNSFIIDNLNSLPGGVYLLRTYVDGNALNSKIVISYP